MRTTLYEELSATRRARRHRQVAEALERRGDADPVALTNHLKRAGTIDARAIDYSAAAGVQALHQLAFDQAVTYFAQALELAEDLGLGADRRCALFIGLGTAQRLAAIPSYRETLLTGAGLARDLDDAELLAQAALANSRGLFSSSGVVDEERVDVLEAACSVPSARRTQPLGLGCSRCWPSSSPLATRSCGASIWPTKPSPWPVA